MRRKRFKTVSLPRQLIQEIEDELKKDKVFKSKASLITHVMRTYLEKRKEKTPLSVKL